VRRVRGRLAEAGSGFREVFGNPDLRRLELAWAGAIVGKWAFGVALLVYAYDAGGAAAVGLLGLVRWTAAGVTAPFVALLADRFDRRRVMIASDLVRVAALALAGAVALADGPALAVYGLGILSTIAAAAFRPAQAAIVSTLARSPTELTAANVVSSTIESVGIFAGPALAGLLLAVTDEGTVFAATAATFLWSALLVARIGRGEATAGEARPAEGILREATAGFRAVVGDRRVALLVGLFTAQTFVDGILGVLLVVTSFELLGLGEAGVGWLNSAIGVGGVLGAAAGVALVGRRLARPFALGILFWGLPLALVGVFPSTAAALVLLAVVGVANTVVDVAAMTLLQRAVPNEVLARVFGVLESLVVLSVGIGAAVAPLLVAGVGERGALLATGAILPALALVTWRQVAAIDAEAAPAARELELLRRVPFLAPLPAETLEPLAARLVPTPVPAGEAVFRRGDHGDRFYVVGSGALEVQVDGRSEPLGPGDFFGEIALIRDVPRTATVVALEDAELLALERDDFVGAVTGHAPSREAAETLVGARLGTGTAAA
jgi:MFS family permease